MDKKAILSSFSWSAVETYSVQGIAFIVSLIMARILTPSDYGLIGIISIFIALSETFIDSGFTNALINKKNCNNVDYSTVFYFNIIISIILFIILYFSAPFIASFYNNEMLLSTTRVMSITFVISAFGAIPTTILTKELNFRAKACISLIVSIASGAIGITMAYCGFGVWALVWQSVLSVVIRVIIYCLYVRWMPILFFSIQSFKELFEYGSKLLVSNIIYTLFNNIYNLVIGKVFNTTQLGYFSRADSYSKLIPINLSGVLSKFLFPVLSKINDNDKELINLHKDIVIVTSLFIFPGCLFLAGLAAPLVHLLISDKWMPIVPILQILCFAGIFEHFSSINSNFILAKGKSNLFLKMHVFTKPIGIIILIVSVIFNLEIVACGKVLYSIACFLVGYYYLRKVLPISFISSMKEISKLFMISFLISVVFIAVFLFISYSWINLILVALTGCVVYLIMINYFCPDSFDLIIKFKKIIKK